MMWRFHLVGPLLTTEEMPTVQPKLVFRQSKWAAAVRFVLQRTVTFCTFNSKSEWIYRRKEAGEREPLERKLIQNRTSSDCRGWCTVPNLRLRHIFWNQSRVATHQLTRQLNTSTQFSTTKPIGTCEQSGRTCTWIVHYLPWQI